MPAPVQGGSGLGRQFGFSGAWVMQRKQAGRSLGLVVVLLVVVNRPVDS